MEEINLKDLGEYFISKIFYILFITIFVFAVGIVYVTIVEHPKYKSSTSLILTGFSDTTNKDAAINTNDLNVNQKLLVTYQEITKSKKVLSKVISDLKLDYEVDRLAKRVDVIGVPETEIIKISVVDENAGVAYKIVKRISEVFSEEVKSIYNVSNISILDEPEIASKTANIGILKASLLSLGSGILISFIILFILYYFDTTIKNTEQIEAKIDVPILGSIPDYNAKKRGKK